MEETKKQNWFIRLWNYYSTYEKIWFISITILAFVFAFIFPEEDIGGVNGKIIMALYLIDIFSNILCELLISKQSKWNFLVSLVVEFTEIAICIVCAYRFATMATTIFFWIPVDIISFFVWHKNPDREKSELTEVRTLKGWQELLVILGIIVWTIGIGYLLTLINVEEGILSDSPTLNKVVCYLDACCSVVGIANGLFILFRYREQWFAWYIATFLEIAMNIIAGQWVLLVLKAGYLSNTTYGMIKWSKYIKNKEQKEKKLITNPSEKEEIFSKLTKGVKPIKTSSNTSEKEVSTETN
ncbi:MAG: nicotinamide mononucleotide transporter [Bacilli bacterium]|nr:nicotinamide mononucleotide transporter [Bacilli bacterium]